nr:hypothetical protein BaRGS_030089 [Batillaria attramentaria]
MRGFEHYLQPTKRFMKGVDPYIQTYLSHLQSKKSDFEDSEPRDKRFLKGINPYLQIYASRYQDKRYNGDWYGSSPNKRFMKGINPYLQMLASRPLDKRSDFDLLDSAPEKRFIKGPLLQIVSKWLEGKQRETVKGIPAHKRFLKGINPYLQLYSNQLDDKRYGDYYESAPDKRFMKGMDEHLMKYINLHDTGAGDEEGEEKMEAVPADKRFLKGVDHYILHYANLPRVKRDANTDAIESKEDVTKDDVTKDDITSDKRFLKGINPYLQMYASRPAMNKKSEGDKPVGEKRFMKGVNQYLQMYANRPQFKRDDGVVSDSDLSTDKRFMKGIDNYLQLYRSHPQGKRDGHDNHLPDKRFMKGINMYLQNYANAMPDKRFMKGINPYLRNLATLQGSKRFMRGFHPYIQTRHTNKRFMKGVNKYIQAFGSQGKRDSDVTLKEKERRVPDTSLPEKNVSTEEAKNKPEKKFMKGVNQYIQMHSSAGRKRRQADVIDEDTIRRTEFGPLDMDLPPQKRFLKGINSYLRHYASYQRPTRSDIDDIETAVGDGLVLELADTAKDMIHKGSHSPHKTSDFKYDQNEARWLPRASSEQLNHPRKYSLDGDLDDDEYGSSPQKRVFLSARRSWRPSYGSRQFLMWYNGDYRLG